MSKHTEQIRKMAEEKYPTVEMLGFNTNGLFREIYKQGSIDTLANLDIDENKFMDITIQYSLGRISTEEAKQQILQSITIKEKPCTK